MFSYLHGMRPGNRRSAIPPSTYIERAAPSRNYHEGATASIESSLDQFPPRTPDAESPREPLRISTDPPILPPIPRIASRHEPYRRNDVAAVAQKGQLQPSDAQAQPSQRPPLTTSKSVEDNNSYAPSAAAEDATSKEFQSIEMPPPPTPSVQFQQAQARQLRLKRLAYESVRSYSEPHLPPTAQSSESPNPLPQPGRQPPLPPPLLPPALKITQPEMSHTNNVRPSKTKLNLLNPMSLLAKRRSSHAVAEASAERYSQNRIPNSPGMRLPDDYDPRIRGKVVHDFSAPRPGRNHSTNIPTARTGKDRALSKYVPPRLSPNSSTLSDEESPGSSEREHTPVFKEHFDDDIEPWVRHNGPTKQRASAFVYRMSATETESNLDSSSLPPFARGLPPILSTGAHSASKTLTPPSKAPLEAVLETALTDAPTTRELQTSSPPTSPPRVRPRSTSNSDSSPHPAELLRHIKSNASRFSFDLAGVGSSTQENLLEEKHREKAKQKARASVASGLSNTNRSEHDVEDEEEDFDYDNMDDDGKFEERIPGINADDEVIDMHVSMQTVQGFDFTSPTKSSFAGRASPQSTDLALPATPHDDQGGMIEFASTKTQRNLGSGQSLDVSENSFDEDRAHQYPVPNRQFNPEDHSHPLQQPSSYNLPVLPQSKSYQNDDMYFDDGMIDDFGDLGDENDEVFDESLFDDETSRIYGLPLRDLKPLNHPSDVPNSNDLQALGLEIPSEHGDTQSIGVSPTDQPSQQRLGEIGLETRNSLADTNRTSRPTFSQKAGLTQDNLAAYHDALAFAANQADLNGQFIRQQSDPHSSPKEILDGGRMSREVDGLPINPIDNGTDDYDYDDALTDDPIVAAANAEALENDDDGFYGQEFGFFACASDSGEVQYANGGYFGPRGIEGIGRSRSGRVNFQEPSLTPITERSEWSNRNSAISLAMLGYPTQALASPGLVQLADIMHLDEGDNMSLSALMKLRRGAWGGSNGSLQSSSSGSPLTFLPPSFPSASNTAPQNNIGNRNSFAASNYSLASSNGIGSDDSENSPCSPTITLTTTQEGVVLEAPYIQAERSCSPVRRSAMSVPLKGKSHHSRNSSGASESVSYVKEIDEEGERWVLEKRRTGEGGQVEILGRQVVEGGRI